MYKICMKISEVSYVKHSLAHSRCVTQSSKSHDHHHLSEQPERAFKQKGN